MEYFQSQLHGLSIYYLAFNIVQALYNNIIHQLSILPSNQEILGSMCYCSNTMKSSVTHVTNHMLKTMCNFNLSNIVACNVLLLPFNSCNSLNALVIGKSAFDYQGVNIFLKHNSLFWLQNNCYCQNHINPFCWEWTKT